MRTIESRIIELENRLAMTLNDKGIVWDFLCGAEESMSNYDYKGNHLYSDEQWKEVFSRLFVSRERFIEIVTQGKPYDFPEYNKAVMAEIVKIQEDRMSKNNRNSSIEIDEIREINNMEVEDVSKR